MKNDNFNNIEIKNRYFLLRHGETNHQIEKNNIIYFWPEDKPPADLTKKGRKQIEKVAEKLKNKRVNLIFSSDTLRTRQGAEIIARKIGLKVNLDSRLRDINWGVFQGRPKSEAYNLFYNIEGFSKGPEDGESWGDCQKRLKDFLEETEKKHQDKNILIISHGDPLWLLQGIIKGLTNEELLREKLEKRTPKLGELRKL